MESLDNSVEEKLDSAFSGFKNDPLQRLRVQLRRRRAQQLRDLLSPDTLIDLDTFNKEVWVLESRTYLRGQDITGRIFGEDLSLDQIADIEAALEAGELEFHGNAIWGTATRVFAPRLRDVRQKEDYIQQAVAVLNSNNTAWTPKDRAREIAGIYGFGLNIATGLAMVFHPTEFAIYNRPSVDAVRRLGYAVDSLDAYQVLVDQLRDDLGAEDFIELDWFLYLLNQGRYGMWPNDEAINLTWLDCIKQVLAEADRPLPGDEIVEGVMALGFATVGKTPIRTANRVLHDHPELFRQVEDGWILDAANLSIRESLETVLSRYVAARTGERFGRQHELWSVFDRIRSVLTRHEAVKKYPTIKVGWSVGKGNWAKVPWITILDTRETVTTQSGIYCVYLFRQDMTGVYLTLAQGVTEPRKLYGGLEAQRYLHSTARDIRQECAQLLGHGFALDDQIDLRTDPGLGADYDDSTIAYRFYGAGTVPEDEELVSDLSALLDAYESYVDRNGNPEGQVKSYWIFQANPKIYDLSSSVMKLSKMTWLVRQHADEIKPGDIVFLWESGEDGGLVALSTVQSEVTQLAEGEDELPFVQDHAKLGGPQPRVQLSIDRVLQERIRRSDLLAHPALREMSFVRAPQGTNFPVTEGQAAALMSLIEGTPGATTETVTQASLEDLADELLVSRDFVEGVVDLLRERRQIIFYGPPGTGKTYVARKLMQHLAPSDTRREVVQFHPSYSYEDFVQGYRPITKDGELTYQLKPGPLMSLATRAARSTEDHILLIDEINRGNLPKILGELLYLLEYRDDEVSLMYAEGDCRFSLPKNLLIIGTMNTADRSIALVDAALRRRFHFVPLFPNHQPLDGLLRRWLERHRPEMVYVADVVDVLNARLRAQFGPHLQVGHSYFMRKDLSGSVLRRIWEYDVMPFLQDQLFGQEQELENYQLDRLRESGNANNRVDGAPVDTIPADQD